MLIGHIPAGYLVTKIILNEINCTDSEFKFLFWCGVISSILPDFDLFYYYLIDNHQHHHHSYWIHIPFYWFVIASFSLLFGLIFHKRMILLITLIVFSNVMLHLLLDSVTSKIKWLYPFSDNYFGIFIIPAEYNWWVWSFIFHWTFLIEITIFLIASYIFIRQ